MDATEADWIEGCKAGRRRAFEPLVRRYGPRAYRFALGIVGDAEEAKRERIRTWRHDPYKEVKR